MGGYEVRQLTKRQYAALIGLIMQAENLITLARHAPGVCHWAERAIGEVRQAFELGEGE